MKNMFSFLTLTVAFVLVASLGIAQEAVETVTTVAPAAEDQGIFSWFTSNWMEVAGIFAAFVLVFDRIAKLTPTESDNKIVTLLYKVFAILGLKVPDIK